MTFLAASSIQQLDQPDGMPSLSQRGRASMQFLGAAQRYSSSVLRPVARADFESDPEGRAVIAQAAANTPPSGKPEWLSQARRVAEKSANFQMERFLQRIVAEEVFLRGVPAVEECRPAFQRYLDAPLKDTGSTLELDPTLPIPDYYQGVEWHLQIGGWDGFDLYGPFFALVAGPHVFRHGGYAAVGAGDDIIAQRKGFIAQLPRKDYRRIYEPGCGGFSTLACAHAAFPQAELVGSDLSPTLLRMGYTTSRRLGVTAHFKQRDCRDTREPDGSFDAVLMYALLHEMPPKDAVATIREAYRILAPGGDLVISDPPPFRAVDPFQAVVLEWDTAHREEPFFTAAASANWSQALGEAGFTDVAEYAIGQHGYPWITRGHKPG